MSTGLIVAILSGAVALAVGLLILAFAGVEGWAPARWSLLGWVIMAVTGVGGGAWAVRRHGDPGPGFFLAFGICMLARLIASALGAATAAAYGMDAVWPYLAGLVATYAPLQIFEMSWFLRQTRSDARSTG